MPFTLIGCSNPSGQLAAPPTQSLAPMRTMLPPAQRSPSPKGTPTPSFAMTVPWKNKHEAEGGRLLVCSSSDSCAIDASP
jgi:hypothetical protein